MTTEQPKHQTSQHSVKIELGKHLRQEEPSQFPVHITGTHPKFTGEAERKYRALCTVAQGSFNEVEFLAARNVASRTLNEDLQMVAAESPDRFIRLAVVHNLNVKKPVLLYLKSKTNPEVDSFMAEEIEAAIIHSEKFAAHVAKYAGSQTLSEREPVGAILPLQAASAQAGGAASVPLRV